MSTLRELIEKSSGAGGFYTPERKEFEKRLSPQTMMAVLEALEFNDSFFRGDAPRIAAEHATEKALQLLNAHPAKKGRGPKRARKKSSLTEYRKMYQVDKGLYA